MQGLGHINAHGEKVLVLVRQSKTYWSYKIRKGGKDGFEAMDNAFFASEEGRQYLERLKKGETIIL